MSAEFVAAMEDVLDLYEEPYDPQRPTVCFDETSTQLIGESRIPLPARPGRRERFDYEYRRNGTRNLFMLCEPLRMWRSPLAVISSCLHSDPRLNEEAAVALDQMVKAAYRSMTS